MEPAPCAFYTLQQKNQKRTGHPSVEWHKWAIAGAVVGVECSGGASGGWGGRDGGPQVCACEGGAGGGVAVAALWSSENLHLRVGCFETNFHRKFASWVPVWSESHAGLGFLMRDYCGWKFCRSLGVYLWITVPGIWRLKCRKLEPELDSGDSRTLVW